MSLKKYTVAVVGLGKRGKHHISAFSRNPRFEVLGICDIDSARVDSVKKEFNVQNSDTDAKKLLNKIKPDIFCFCTLPNIRLDMIKIGVEAGVKLIAYEKPIALSTNEALEIMNLLRNAKVKSVVSHQHRYGEHYRKVNEIIRSGAIGRVHTVYGTATGWMMHMMTHLIDYCRWFNDNAGAEWVMGQASGTTKFKDIHVSPDYIAGIIHFTNGVRGIIECGAGAPDVPEVDYWWRKCRIGAQGTEGFAEVLTGGGWRAITKNSKGVISGPGCMNYDLDMPPYIQDIAEWLDNENKVHPCNGESAYKGFEIMMGVCRSVIEGGQIKLPLSQGYKELESLAKKLVNTPTFSTTAETAKQYL
ncbi:MAG: Gfo/Idh/MocA family oxidoreductase [Elusimicrobia bacterium]|nr:Gfo/Idh/MocA family oxidoreductase [Elusimicrobiota bacterium]